MTVQQTTQDTSIDIAEIEELISDQRDAIEPIILECLRELFHHIPKGHEFILSNGKTAKTKTFVEPRYNEDRGEFEFGIDVRIDDFTVDHIEFFMTKTGHGGSVNQHE